MRLTASGSAPAGGGTGRECIENLLNTGSESWNKWFDVSTSDIWIQADFEENSLFSITGYSLCSANDSPGRDPMAWTLLGKLV